jgi:hypothetical protein
MSDIVSLHPRLVAKKGCLPKHFRGLYRYQLAIGLLRSLGFQEAKIFEIASNVQGFNISVFTEHLAFDSISSHATCSSSHPNHLTSEEFEAECGNTSGRFYYFRARICKYAKQSCIRREFDLYLKSLEGQGLLKKAKLNKRPDLGNFERNLVIHVLRQEDWDLQDIELQLEHLSLPKVVGMKYRGDPVNRLHKISYDFRRMLDSFK